MKRDVIQIESNHDICISTEKVIRSVIDDLMHDKLSKLSTRYGGYIINSYYNSSCYSMEYDSSTVWVYEMEKYNHGESLKLVGKENINENDSRVLDTIKNLSEIYNIGVNIKKL